MLRHLWRYLRFLGEDRRRRRRLAATPFHERGFEVVPEVMPRETCAEVAAVVEGVLRPESYIIDGDCYLYHRKGRTRTRGVDERVSQVFNAQRLHPALEALHESRTLEELAVGRVGRALSTRAFTVQVDDPDTATKRGWHVDDLFPHHYKVFVYLTDVEVREDGAFTVIPGTHRPELRFALPKALNVLRNAALDHHRTDMDLFFSDDDAHCVLGPAGTGIVSTQTLVHKGWQEQSGGRRMVLIVYLSEETDAAAAPFLPGLDELRREER